MGPHKFPAIISGFTAAIALIVSGCGGANLAPDCTGFRGQYGAAGSDPALLRDRIVKIYSITNCASDDVNASCSEVLIDTIVTGNDGTFKINGLTNGDYRVRIYSVDGTQLVQTNRVNLPDVCNAKPTPTPTPTPTPAAG
jgi:hypothetical protein